MKKFILSLCMASASLGLWAQTHQEGVEYYRADQFNNALELLERNYNNPGTDKAIANYYLGLLAIKQKDMAKARKYFTDGIAINPEYPYNYIGLGSLELKNNNLKEAESEFKKAEKFNKKDAALQVAIARAYYESSPEGAVTYAKQIEKALKEARKRNMTEPEIFIFEGDVAYDNGDINQAASMYDMATTYNEKAADAYVKYANIYTKFNPQYSVDMLKKLLSKNPQSALGQRELANAYYEQKDYKNAANYYGSYVNNPNHFKNDEDRYALLLFFDSDFQKGYDYATKLLQETPDNFTAQRFQLMNAAQIPAMSDQLLPLAEKLWAAHLANPKKNAFAAIDYNLLASEFTQAKKYDMADNVLREAIKDDPNNAGYYKMLALIPLDQNDYAAAADAWKTYLGKVEAPSYNDLLQEALLCYYAGATNTDATQKAKADSYLNDAVEYARKASAVNAEQYRPYKILGDALILLAPKADQATVATEAYNNALKYIDQEKYTNDYDTIAKYLKIK